MTEETPPNAGVTTAADSIANIESLSTLAAALAATDLDDVLNAQGPFTIFAPNNAAFAGLLAALELADLDAVVAELTKGGVANLLQAHVVGGVDSLGAAEVEAAVGGDSLQTLNDNFKIGVTKVGDRLVCERCWYTTS